MIDYRQVLYHVAAELLVLAEQPAQPDALILRRCAAILLITVADEATPFAGFDADPYTLTPIPLRPIRAGF